MPAPVWVLLYSLVAHLGVSLGQPGIPLTLLGLILVWVSLRARWARWLASIAVVGLVIAAGARSSQIALYLTPVAIHTLLLWVFARTLRAHDTPLITRIALFMGATPSPELRRYTRAVTLAWCVFFATMATLAALLALAAPTELWSAFVHGIVYLLLALFFVIEYAVRMRVLPMERRQGFIAFVRALGALNFRAMARTRS